MENKTKNFKEIVKERTNWKQWIPIYGIYQAHTDNLDYQKKKSLFHNSMENKR